jgi:SulP family sulfate permease
MANTEQKPDFGALFTPKLLTVLREGYGVRELQRDAIAGLTVAIVALPLSLAIAIASGVAPERGLAAAIIGGFLVSALGGSRFQIGGPAGAFIVLVSATAAEHGVDGMLIATFLAGIMLLAAGLLRLGGYVRLVPYPVTIGFTAGIAVIIIISQIKELLGLTLEGAEPGPILDKLIADVAALETANFYAAGVALSTIALIIVLRRLRPQFPGVLVAVSVAAAAVAIFDLPAATIGTRFGELPRGLPPLAMPTLTAEKAIAVLPNAFAFFLLGAIESLLSATVGDAMTGRRHRSNCELAAQGFANMASSLFGGMVVTGTIARTATNIRAGAHGPVAGMLHAVYLLVFVIAAAPLAAIAPLAALSGVLVVVAWNMIERHAIAALFRSSAEDVVAFSATFFLTVFRDLTEAIAVGTAIAAIAFIRRMSSSFSVGDAIMPDDIPDSSGAERTAYRPQDAQTDHVAVYRLAGAVFFASATSLSLALDRVLAGQKALVLDLSEVSLIDSTGAQAIAGFIRDAEKRNVRVGVAGASVEILKTLAASGATAKARVFDSIQDALDKLR